MAEQPAPELVPESAERKVAVLGDESKKTGSGGSYAYLLPFSRKAWIRADLQNDITRFFEAGRAVGRATGDQVFSVLTTNADLSDGVAFFHSTHGNMGTGGAPSVTSLDEIFNLMATHQGPSLQTLNIMPRYRSQRRGRHRRWPYCRPRLTTAPAGATSMSSARSMAGLPAMAGMRSPTRSYSSGSKRYRR